MSTIITPSRAGGGSIYPTLKADLTYRGPSVDISASNTTGRLLQGFVGNGDYFELPNSGGGTLKYFDSNGVESTTGSWNGGVAHTDINAAADNWTAFRFDGVDNLLQMVAYDTAGPNIYVKTINVSGSIVDIGTVTPTTPFVNTPEWNQPSIAGSASLYRVSDGAGDFTLRMVSAARVYEFVMDSSNASEVVDVTLVATGDCHYKTASGIYIGSFFHDDSVLDTIQVDISGANNSARARLPTGTGIPDAENGCIWLEWNGGIVAGVDNSAIRNIRAVTIINANKFADALAKAVGVS